MRLLKCHIENFGKLSNFSFDFEANPVVLNKQNGWGKSTLAMFIKVMFFGFANEKKRDSLECERKRYAPWQHGVYGGELVFETRGKKYRMNRVFAEKDSEDVFELYDAETNLKSEDFSNQIGEELFQINQESFLRTVYIAQNDCATHTTDSINAKVGNLEDNLNDISNYEKAQDRLKQLKNQLDPSKKKGEIKKLGDEMEGLKLELRKRAAVEEAIASLEEHLWQCDAGRSEIRQQQEDLQKEMADLGRYKEIAAKKEHYGKIQGECEERRASLEEYERFFCGKVPSGSEIQGIAGKRKDMVRQEADMRANELSPAERERLEGVARRFAEGVPDEQRLTRGHSLVEQLESLRDDMQQQGFSAEEEQELRQLKRRFGDNELEEGTLDAYLQQWNLCTDIRNGLGTKRASLASLRMIEENAIRAAQEKAQRKKFGYAVFLPPILLAFVGIALCFWNTLAGVALIAVGVVVAVVMGIVRGTRNGKAGETADMTEGMKSGADEMETEILSDEQRAAEAERDVLDFLGMFDLESSANGGEGFQGVSGVRDKLYALKNDLKRLRRLEARQKDYQNKGYEAQVARVEEELHRILLPYYTVGEIQGGNAKELLMELEKDRDAFGRLKEKEERYRRAAELHRGLQRTVRDFLKEYGYAEEQEADACLRDVSQKLTEYENAREEFRKCRDELEEFEQRNDVKEFETLFSESLRDVEDVKAQLQLSADKMEKLHESREHYLSQLDEKQQEMEELDDKQELLAEMEERMKDLRQYYDNLVRTSDYLARAKENFSARYMGPISSAFSKNYEVLSGSPATDFQIDANISIDKKEQGLQRNIGFFSAGCQDLIWIAFRLALVEAMYQDEVPFLIFDDSFVDLDDDKLERAKEFMKGVAEKYQVIYFTCHESRVL